MMNKRKAEATASPSRPVKQPKSSDQFGYLDSLPQEVTLRIGEFAGRNHLPSLLCLAVSSRSFYSLLSDSLLWRRVYYHTWPLRDGRIEDMESSLDWRAITCERFRLHKQMAPSFPSCDAIWGELEMKVEKLKSGEEQEIEVDEGEWSDREDLPKRNREEEEEVEEEDGDKKLQLKLNGLTAKNLASLLRQTMEQMESRRNELVLLKQVQDYIEGIKEKDKENNDALEALELLRQSCYHTQASGSFARADYMVSEGYSAEVVFYGLQSGLPVRVLYSFGRDGAVDSEVGDHDFSYAVYGSDKFKPLNAKSKVTKSQIELYNAMLGQKYEAARAVLWGFLVSCLVDKTRIFTGDLDF